MNPETIKQMKDAAESLPKHEWPITYRNALPERFQLDLARHIALCSPANVLELIRENEHAVALLTEAWQVISSQDFDAPGNYTLTCQIAELIHNH